jgi:hypothetical protein
MTRMWLTAVALIMFAGAPGAAPVPKPRPLTSSQLVGAWSMAWAGGAYLYRFSEDGTCSACNYSESAGDPDGYSTQWRGTWRFDQATAILSVSERSYWSSEGPNGTVVVQQAPFTWDSHLTTDMRTRGILTGKSMTEPTVLLDMRRHPASLSGSEGATWPK